MNDAVIFLITEASYFNKLAIHTHKKKILVYSKEKNFRERYVNEVIRTMLTTEEIY